MAYRHVDESRRGDDYVIGRKRLRIDHTKAVFMGLIGLLSAVFIWETFNELSMINKDMRFLGLVGLGVAILWGLFAFIESSTIYYSETPCFQKSVKLVYLVFFISSATSFITKARLGYGKLTGVIEVALIGLVLYLLYRMIAKALRAKKKNRAITRH